MNPLNDLKREVFPHILVILASAGTGKTHNLSTRVARYLLADRSEVPFNDLRNILAITFTINASKEMKKRVLNWLKGLSLKDEKTASFLGIPKEMLEKYAERSESLVNRILNNFKDFQIKTIDSFLATIFKASANTFGYFSNFQVVLNNREYLQSAYNLYVDELTDTDLKDDFFKVLDFINENEPRFSFTPDQKIFEIVKSLYEKEKHFAGGFTNQDRSIEWAQKKAELKAICKKINDFISENGLNNCLSSTGFINMLKDLENDDFEKFFSRGDGRNPYKKEHANESWTKKIDEYWETIKLKRKEAIKIYSENYFYPYIKVLKAFEEKINYIKKSEEIIFIEDIPGVILKNLNENNIPDVYIRLGVRLYHFFIDEFQDTSSIQWENIKMLVENSLSTAGSLYVVGDTKQAIYGFRDTDYRIMKSLYDKQESFSPVKEKHFSYELEKNFRSGEIILNYVKNVFESAKDSCSDFYDSGLFDSWKVEVSDDKKNRGYVSSKVVYNGEEDENPKEKNEVLNIIQDCLNRGYSYSDITILAHKNKEIVEISSWLNQEQPAIPFISYSSLDIRERRVIKEILNLLRFLDSPRDNLSFSKFLLGDIFRNVCDVDIKDFIFRNRGSGFLYKKFENEFFKIWKSYFEAPFKYVGYLPIYELLCVIISVFKIKEGFPDDSGAIAKLLEIVKDLEGLGKNSLSEFLDFIEDKENNEYESSQIFELPIPENFDGVRLMTVHKAKGLSAKVLIYLVYESKALQDSLKIVEDKSGYIKVMKINSSYVDEDLKGIYEDLKRKQKINDLNSFYVGLTRAEEELYVIGVGKDRGDRNDNKRERYQKAFPLNLILEGEVGTKPDLLTAGLPENKEIYGLELTLSGNLNISEGTASKLGIEEKRRGEYVHSILSEIYNLDDLQRVEEISKKFNIYYPEFDPVEIYKSIESFINEGEIKPFFDVSKDSVFLENSFADSDGIIRIDRLIVGEREVLIIDFKTGDIEEGHKKQLERYGKAIKEIYKRKISCYLLYFDKKEAIKVYEY
ncbi:MAG: UvrD-helicase domain-containing protein [Proteobacteria bacterium]|nr:UvrD-helicase domain-containing protein [Pseudomonadota bacterium]